MENYKEKYELGSIVIAKRTFNRETITGAFGGFYLLDKSNPKSIVGVVHTPNGSYDVEPNSIKSVISKDEKIRKELWEYFHNLQLSSDCDFSPSLTIDDILSRLEKQGEQKHIDNIEPKFKVGDFIINEYGFIMQIDGIDGNMYIYHVLDGNVLLKHDITKTEESCHLWTIQDAKDGDVFYHKGPLTGIEYIVMSKGINGFGNIDSYFRYNSVDGFGTYIPSVFNAKSDDITPATKEQRDLLFQKMKEAGYEWDDEKKELKKI